MIAIVALMPQLLYPPLSQATLSAVADPRARIELQQSQAQLQNNARSLLLQGFAGLLVVIGAIATWRQVQVVRDGHITDRFTRAVDQLGSDNADVRIGGIYALERVARNSTIDRPSIQYILAAFVRGHAPWPDGPPSQHPTNEVDQTLSWLYVRAPEIQAAMNVLGRRPPAPGALRLYLSRVDLRSVNLNDANLANTRMRYANLARAWLAGARLDGSDLKGTDLRQANAVHARLVDVVLREACLEGTDLRGADLRRADLRGADMRATNLDQAVLTGAHADQQTKWPVGFDDVTLRAHRVLTSDEHPHGTSDTPSVEASPGSS